MKDIAAIIMGGGQGTRLGELSARVPKALLPVGGRPFFEHVLVELRRPGASEFVFLVNHLGRDIIDHFGDGRHLGVNIVYSEDGDEPLGTGGALRKALPQLADDFVDPLLEPYPHDDEDH